MTSEAVVLSWNLIINLLLVFVILIVTLLIAKWVVSFVFWKWQDMIDTRAKQQQQQQQHSYKDDRDQDDDEEEENEPRTHYTAKTTRRRK